MAASPRLPWIQAMWLASSCANSAAICCGCQPRRVSTADLHGWLLPARRRATADRRRIGFQRGAPVAPCTRWAQRGATAPALIQRAAPQNCWTSGATVGIVGIPVPRASSFTLADQVTG